MNDIGRFFAQKISRIRDQIDSTDIVDKGVIPEDPPVDDTCVFSKFQPLSHDDIRAIIQKPSKKSCGLDPMPTKLVVQSLEQLLPVIAKMVNSSLLSGYFPKTWRDILVYPRYKKNGIKDFNNLRYVSKLTERAVFDQLYILI